MYTLTVAALTLCSIGLPLAEGDGALGGALRGAIIGGIAGGVIGGVIALIRAIAKKDKK